MGSVWGQNVLEKEQMQRRDSAAAGSPGHPVASAEMEFQGDVVGDASGKAGTSSVACSAIPGRRHYYQPHFRWRNWGPGLSPTPAGW